MMLALGAPAELYYVIAVVLALLDLLLIIPSYWSEKRSPIAKASAAIGTTVAGAAAVCLLLQLMDPELRDESSFIMIVILAAPFLVVFVVGCLGVRRWNRLPKPRIKIDNLHNMDDGH